MERLEMIRDQIAEIKSDVKDIKEDTSDIKLTMAVNTSSLEHHIARTNELQNIVIEFRTELLSMKDEVNKVDLQYKKGAAMMSGALKIIVATGTVLVFLKEVGLLSAIANLF